MMQKRLPAQTLPDVSLTEVVPVVPVLTMCQVLHPAMQTKLPSAALAQKR